MWMAEAKAKKDIPLSPDVTIKAGEKITMTRGSKSEYALWSPHGIFDRPAEYVDQIEEKMKY